MGIKEFFKRLKEENKNLGKTTARMNSDGFCGNVNRGVKAGDFWEGSYIGIENGYGIIYGSNQEDYIFHGKDIVKIDMQADVKTNIPVKQEKKLAVRYIIEFADGMKASADIIVDRLDFFKKSLDI